MDTAKRSFHRGLIKHLIGMNLPLPTFYRLQEGETRVNWIKHACEQVSLTVYVTPVTDSEQKLVFDV